MKYQSNYRDLTGKGREVVIADACESYAYEMADGDIIDDVVESFAGSYQHGEERQADLSITIYQDGEQVDFAQRTI